MNNSRTCALLGADREALMPQRTLKVLIADDSRAVHQLIRNALPAEYATYTVHAFNSEDCLIALDHGVDLAFIDVQMPGMGRLDALWAARTRANKTFIALMSERSTTRCIDLARKLDAYEFLVKPFENDDIASILQTYQRVSTPMRVLLVDDSPTILKIMHKVLVNSIFRLNVEEVNAGDTAIARCKRETFDVVFLDINIPGLNEYETLARLLYDQPQTKIVIITSEHNPSRERTVLQFGAAAIMHKPFFPTEIDAALHRLFGLQSPKLATDDHIRDFGIKIHGRTIAVEHDETGHVYEYVWFRDPPHLRLPIVKENGAAEISAKKLLANVERVAMLELENASLLHGTAH
jgi:CheY-like chemotaxis protein